MIPVSPGPSLEDRLHSSVSGQVSWLSDHPTPHAFPARLLPRQWPSWVSSPITVTGSRRDRTAFPGVPRPARNHPDTRNERTLTGSAEPCQGQRVESSCVAANTGRSCFAGGPRTGFPLDRLFIRAVVSAVLLPGHAPESRGQSRRGHRMPREVAAAIRDFLKG